MAEITDFDAKEAPAAPGEVTTYDFKHPKLVSKEIIRALRNIHEKLSRNLSRIFSTSLGIKVDIDVVDIHQTVFSEYLQSLPSMGTYYVFQIKEFGEWAVMEIDPSFCIYAVERQAGSKRSNLNSLRIMSGIEERIFSRIVDKIFDEISFFWEPYIDMTVGQFVYEYKPENIHNVNAVEPAVIAEYEIRINKQSVPFKICYPYTPLKDAIDQSFNKLGSRPRGKTEDPEEYKIYRDELKNVPVLLKAELGRTQITVEELLRLNGGDAIKLEQSTYAPINILFSNSKKMKAFPGVINKKRAVKVYEINEVEKHN